MGIPSLTKEASSKIGGRLDHAVLGLGSEDRDGSSGCEVVQEFTIKLAIGKTEIEVLASSKRSE